MPDGTILVHSNPFCKHHQGDKNTDKHPTKQSVYFLEYLALGDFNISSNQVKIQAPVIQTVEKKDLYEFSVCTCIIHENSERAPPFFA
jgi:hypothetical protein